MTNPNRKIGFGIEALNVYCGICRISVEEMFESRGLDKSRLDNLMMAERSIALPYEDPVTNAVNAAKPIVDRLSPEEKNAIEILVTATESGLDFSKSLASYVHEYLGLSRNCRLLEVKQACYASTAILQMSIGYLASGISPGAKILVIGTDVSLVNARAEYTEPTIGTGGAAFLLSDQPKIVSFDLGAFGNYSFETMDSARPTVNFEIADVDSSLFSYLDCLEGSYSDYCSRVDEVDFLQTFDYLAFHTPFAGLVRAAHRKMMMEQTGYQRQQIEEDFDRRVLPSLIYPKVVGNLCSASVYLALASIVENEQLDEPRRVGLFSYGSGCSSEFFSGLMDLESQETLAEMEIGKHLDSRVSIDFGHYESLLDENLRCLVPEAERQLDCSRYDDLIGEIEGRQPLLILRNIKNYHRNYDWV